MERTGAVVEDDYAVATPGAAPAGHDWSLLRDFGRRFPEDVDENHSRWAGAGNSAAHRARGNGVTPGQFVIEPATLICLGFEWDITGEDNRNATVEVSYRAAGQTAWIVGMPLLRLGVRRPVRGPWILVVDDVMVTLHCSSGPRSR
jgi:hypothetical protein